MSASNHSDNPLSAPASSTLPLKTSRATIQGGDPLSPATPHFPLASASASASALLSLLLNLTRPGSCDYCQHCASSSSMLIPTLWPLTNTPSPLHQTGYFYTHQPSYACREREGEKERVVGIGWHAKTGRGRTHSRYTEQGLKQGLCVLIICDNMLCLSHQTLYIPIRH